MSEVAVVGGGVIGLSCAWLLAASGVDVTVYDRPRPGRPSDVAAGMLAPICELEYEESDLLHLSVDSLSRWPTFADSLRAESGVDVGLRTDGTLLLATDPDERTRLERRARLWSEHGLTFESLTGRQCRGAEPALSRRVLGALRVDSDHSVDNRAVLRALRTALQSKGAGVVDELAEVVCRDGVVTGVCSTGRLHEVGCVVLAAGVWSVDPLRSVGLHARIRPVKGQQLRLHSPTPLLTRTIRARVDEIDVYLVPRADGTIVVGGTSEDVGHDLRRTPRAAADLLGAACALVPELRDTELLEHSVGLRPATRDNRPYLGATGIPGLVLASGHYRHGFLLAPVTAEAVRAAVLHEPGPPTATPFSAATRLRPEGSPA